ncbi:MAG: hypothetical protein EOO88_55080, partial [Pedobacter sp.]
MAANFKKVLPSVRKPPGAMPGSLSSSSQTPSSGVATYTGLKVLKTSVVRLHASSGGFDACSSGITVTAGAASTITISGGDAQSAVVASTLTTAFSVTVRDANSNLINGAAVNWAVATGGGSLSTTSSST